MARFFVTTTTLVNTGHAMILQDTADTVFIASGVTLGTRDVTASGLIGNNSDQLANIAGFAIGATGVTMYGSTARVNVLSGGAILGDGVGLEMRGAGGETVNEGTISGTIAFYSILATDITNYGRMSGSGYGLFAEGGGRYINHGDITGNTAILIGDTTELTNFGSITGVSAVLLGDGTDTFINSGTVLGIVQMGGGDDLLDTTGGRMFGTVAMDAGNDRFIGGDLADAVSGGSGDDDLTGNAGNDRFIAGNADGEDTIDGGAGIDIYDGRAVTTAILADLTAGFVRFGGETDQITGIEQVFGGTVADLLRGNSGANMFRGMAGNDTLYGGGGNDTLFGGIGADYLAGGDANDVVFGDEGRDRLLGDAGDDRIVGGIDVDTVTGGTGADQFDFNDFEEFIPINGIGLDRITDFTRGEDLIDLATMDANQFVAGNQAFVFVGTGTIDAYGEVGYRVEGANTIISIGYNTTTAYDVIVLTGAITLTATDFLL